MVAGNYPTYCWCQHLFFVAFINHHRCDHFVCCYMKSLCHFHRYRPRHRCCHWSLMWSRIANGGHWGHAAQMTYQSLFLPPCSFLPRWRHIIIMAMNKKAKEIDEIIFTNTIRYVTLDRSQPLFYFVPQDSHSQAGSTDVTLRFVKNTWDMPDTCMFGFCWVHLK